MKKISILVLLLLSLASSCYASSQDQAPEKTYQVKESQMIGLETRLQRLKQINQENLVSLQSQQKKLVELQVRSQYLEKRLQQQSQDSKKQEELLKSVNQSFQTFAKEQKEKLHKEKTQKVIWIGVSVILAGICLSK